MTASVANGTVSVSGDVDKVVSQSKDLKLQIALVEKELTYSGACAFIPWWYAPWVGRGAKISRWPGPRRVSFTEKFDLAKVSEAIRAHLDDYESKGHRGEPFRFVEKLYRIDPARLAVVALVQDAGTKHVLQAAYVDLEAPAASLVTAK